MKETIKFNLNGKDISLNVESGRLLLWVLRTDLGLTGAKYGCGEGHCGACSVLIDGEAVRSCITTMKAVRNKRVVTIEGLEKDGVLHPVQKAFADNDALQCGYCTPGMILNTISILNKNPHPTDREILMGLEDNLCRCGAHTRILKAVRQASDAMGGGK